MAPFSRSSFIPKSISLSPECRNDPVVLELKVINNNMRKIDAYVVLGLKGKRKQLEDQRKRDTDSKRREKKLGLEKQRKANPINFIKEKLPKTGFLDAIRNFILYTAMGMAVPFALKNLPKILGIVKFIIPFYKLFEDFAGNVLGGIVSAIDFGYKVHDKVRNIFKKVTGDKFEKSFDDLEKNLNTFLNLAVVLGLAVAGSGAIPRPKGGKVPSGFPASAKTLPKGSLSRLNDSYSRFIAGQANIGDRARLVKNGFINVGQATTKGGPNVLAKGATKSGGKFIGKFGRVFSRIPVVGGLINFAVSMMMGEKIGRASAKAVGSTFGAALGTFVPFPGVGTILGGIVGDIVGGALYDTLESFGKPKKYASGGRVGSKSYSRIPRTIKKARAKRPPKQLRQRTMPGKNVGGEDNIKKLFPDSDNDNAMSPLRLLKKNAGVMKKAGVFGNLLSSGVEMMALGQKIERPTLMGLEKYLAFVIDSSIDDQSTANAKMLGSSMFAMASGGVVPTSRTISQNGATTGSTVAKEIVRSFTAMLDNRSTEIFQNIRRELELKAPSIAPEIAPGTPGVGGLQVTSSSPDFWLLVTAALFENNNPQSGYQGAADVAQAIYNRVSLPGWPKSIRGVILEKGQFQPVRDYGGYGAWGNIKDKESAIAFIKRFGHSQDALEGVAAAILNKTRQDSARNFVGSRDNFRSDAYERANNHLDNATEQSRFGHVFGFEHRGANIAAFKAGQLSPAMINQQVVMGQVSQTQMGTGNVSLDEIRRLAESMGVPLSSYIRGPRFLGDESYHISGQAMDFSNGYGPTPEMLKLAQTIASRYGSSLAELFYTPLGYGIKNGKRVSLSKLGSGINNSHYNHVHVAIVGGRPLTQRSNSLSKGDNSPQTLEEALKRSGRYSPRPAPLPRSTHLHDHSSTSKPLNIASSPQQQRLQQISNIASKIQTGIEKETQILIQPVIA